MNAHRDDLANSQRAHEAALDDLTRRRRRGYLDPASYRRAMRIELLRFQDEQLRVQRRVQGATVIAIHVRSRA